MDIKQSSEKQGRPYHLSDSGTVIKRNFILIPAYILLQSIVPIIVVFGSLGITAMITQQAPPQWLYHFSLSLSFVIAQGLILVIFYKMHQSVINDVMKQQWIVAKNKIIKIVIVAIVVYLLLLIVRVIGTALPYHLSYYLTQYEQRTLGLFKSPYVLLVTFISMVFLRPMVEQIIYRYLIIHELGKV
ncbi:MAG: CPBP family intramembrane glutamate endopeptidase, partial [Staphylococcus epidermidis]|nr:CPBP family intramembrane glutamate endopeptidase [Staphylococcus epidermidis]MDU1500192.1 CPBP family intramembrane glutamate endopeptidase [Staphylococcus epidermidis]